MKIYKCIKDYYQGDIMISKEGDTLYLLPDNSTFVDISNGRQVSFRVDNKSTRDTHFVLVEDKTTATLETIDNVNHPKHYTQHSSGVECIDIARHYCFSIGSAIKYLWRAGLKKDSSMTDKAKEIEDLKKAIWYINDRIKELEQ